MTLSGICEAIRYQCSLFWTSWNAPGKPATYSTMLKGVLRVSGSQCWIETRTVPRYRKYSYNILYGKNHRLLSFVQWSCAAWHVTGAKEKSLSSKIEECKYLLTRFRMNGTSSRLILQHVCFPIKWYHENEITVILRIAERRGTIKFHSNVESLSVRVGFDCRLLIVLPTNVLTRVEEKLNWLSVNCVCVSVR